MLRGAVGLIWAQALAGWQLTLVSFGIGLAYILTMVVQYRLAKCKVKNKWRARRWVQTANRAVDNQSRTPLHAAAGHWKIANLRCS